jgi:hypothetical protein
MAADEAYMFKCYDSWVKPGLARFTPHGAFEDSTAPPNAPPRQSIETRCIVLWEPK